ncbi:MAG: hypothetical protein ACUVQ6_06070 [Dissulfurimicrobium sp.]|uniref:hypothetical protein n=1 Tax=Dissulfurimicrobium sp. TaxID=2022436 RepID=UPI00404AC7A8
MRSSPLIFDESQAIKNAASLTARAARLLKAAFRLYLTDTPLENHVGGAVVADGIFEFRDSRSIYIL